MTDFQHKSGQNGLGPAVAETELGETGGGRLSIPVVPWQAKALMSAAWVAGVTALASGLFQLVPIGIVSSCLALLLVAAAWVFRRRARDERIEFDVDVVERWKGDQLVWEASWSEIRQAIFGVRGIELRDRRGAQFALPRSRLSEAAVGELTRSDAEFMNSHIRFWRKIEDFAPILAYIGAMLAAVSWIIGLYLSARDWSRFAMAGSLFTLLGGLALSAALFRFTHRSATALGRRMPLTLGDAALLRQVVDDRPRVFENRGLSRSSKQVMRLLIIGIYTTSLLNDLMRSRLPENAALWIYVLITLFRVGYIMLQVFGKGDRRGYRIVVFRREMHLIGKDGRFVKSIPWEAKEPGGKPVDFGQFYEVKPREAQKVLDELGWLKALEPKRGELGDD